MTMSVSTEHSAGTGYQRRHSSDHAGPRQPASSPERRVVKPLGQSYKSLWWKGNQVTGGPEAGQ